MSLFNFMKGFFGIQDYQDRYSNRDNFGDSEPPNKFRKPIWSSEDDEDDDLDNRTQAPFGFRIFSNPIEIHRFFEHQMNEMLKMFQESDHSPMFPQEGPMFGHEPMFGMPSLPSPFSPGDSDVEDGKPRGGRSLRDYYLKTGYDKLPDQRVIEKRKDSDLDDRVKTGELGPILECLPGSPNCQPDMHRKSGWYRSEITFSTTKPDGTIEERTTIDNGNGKEDIVTRKIGDKSYSVTTSTDANGIQTRTERIINMKKDDLSDFEKHWNGTNILEPNSTPHSWFSFSKFFR